jgi:hypothetical protein
MGHERDRADMQSASVLVGPDVRDGSFTTKMGFRPMSAFPPIATIKRTSPEVHFVPTGDIGKEKRPPIEETVVRRLYPG